MKATVTIEIDVPAKISGKIVTQKEISEALKDNIEDSIKDAQNLESDFGSRNIFLFSDMKVLSAKTNTLIQ